MTDVLTPAKKLVQQGIGTHANEWGSVLNTTLGYIDTAFGGTLVKPVSGNVTLTTEELRNTGYRFTGNLDAKVTPIITFPAFSGLAVLQNNTNVPIICGISGGQSITIPSPYCAAIWSDGIDFKVLGDCLDKLSVETPISHTASAGSDTLPTKPAGFLTVIIQGLARKIPYYNL
jgi:hypothetical protein